MKTAEKSRIARLTRIALSFRGAKHKAHRIYVSPATFVQPHISTELSPVSFSGLNSFPPREPLSRFILGHQAWIWAPGSHGAAKYPVSKPSRRRRYSSDHLSRSTQCKKFRAPSHLGLKGDTEARRGRDVNIPLAQFGSTVWHGTLRHPLHPALSTGRSIACIRDQLKSMV